MKEQIGLIAGKIWDLLTVKGKTGIKRLPMLLNEPSPIVYQAVGWLAREGKIEYHSENGKISVSLIP